MATPGHRLNRSGSAVSQTAHHGTISPGRKPGLFRCDRYRNESGCCRIVTRAATERARRAAAPRGGKVSGTTQIGLLGAASDQLSAGFVGVFVSRSQAF